MADEKKFAQVYALIDFEGGKAMSHRVDTFEAHAADFDFNSMDEVEKILALNVGEVYDMGDKIDGYRWMRYPDDTLDRPISAGMEMSFRDWPLENRSFEAKQVGQLFAAYMGKIEKDQAAADVLGIFLNEDDPADVTRMNEAVNRVLEDVLMYMLNS